MLRNRLVAIYVRLYSSEYLLVVIIAIFAFAIRLVGVWHSFPDIVHPDEPTVVRSALAIRFDPNPKHFDWPHMYFYLNFILYIVFAKLRDILSIFDLRTVFSNLFPLMWNDNLIFYLLTRILSSLFGAFTVIPLYLAGKFAFNKKVGIVAATILAITPYHVWHSQYSLIDVPMLFFVTWVLYFSIRIMKEPNYANYIFAGALLGFGASTKYNGALYAFLIVFAHIFRIAYSENERYFSLSNQFKLLSSGIVSLIAFVIGTPYALLDFDTFTITEGPKGALWQFKNVGEVSYMLQFVRFFTFFFSKLADDFGYTFMYLYILGFVYTLFNAIKTAKLPNKFVIILYICSLVFFYYIAGFHNSRSHYYFITYPFVTLLGGYFYCLIQEHFKQKHILLILCLVFWVIPLFFVINNTNKRIKSNKMNVKLEKQVDSLQFSNYDQ